jgi:hypothetical protein
MNNEDYEVLENIILDNIREVCKKYLDKNKIKESINNIEFEDNTLKIKKQIDEARSVYNMAKARYQEVKDTVNYNVKKCYTELQTASEAIIMSKLALDQAKEQYRQVTGRYKAGVGDAIELKDGENTYLNARLDFYNAILNYNVTAANLEQEIGIPLKQIEEKVIDITREDL